MQNQSGAIVDIIERQDRIIPQLTEMIVQSIMNRESLESLALLHYFCINSVAWHERNHHLLRKIFNLASGKMKNYREGMWLILGHHGGTYRCNLPRP